MNYSQLYKAIDYREGHVVKPIKFIRNELTIGCLPKTTCKTCREDTKGYSDGMCKRCAEGYTNAFYRISEKLFGIKNKMLDTYPNSKPKGEETKHV